MTKLIDEKGHRYGRLLVLEHAEKKYQHGTTAANWWCQCACGNKVVIRGVNLRRGATKSCGCLKGELISKSLTIDITGHRYGRLVAVERASSNKHHFATWLCKCDCGNEVVVVGNHLRNGNTKSCGCLQRELARESHLLPEGVAAFNTLVRSMRASAKKRGYEWKLTKKQVAHLTKQPCHYCGAVPSQALHPSECNGAYIYNGLDRVDNSKGYTVDNVVPCCSGCNYMKRAMTLNEFESRVTRVYKHFVMKRN